MSNIARIARMEFSGVVRQPLVVFIACFLLGLSIFNGIGSAIILPEFDAKLLDGNDHFFYGLSNIMGSTLQYMLIISTFIGVLSILEERSKGSLRVLISKPVYRRDILAGKFFGLSGFLLLLVILEMAVSIASIMIFYRGPSSVNDLLLRVPTCTVVLFFTCLINLSLTLLIGTLLKDMLKTVMITGTLMFIEWFHFNPAELGDLRIINPVQLYGRILGVIDPASYILSTSYDYGQWLSVSTPYILLAILEILAAFTITVHLFNKDET